MNNKSQTTIKTNINYIQKLYVHLKKIISKIKTSSDKLKLKKTTCTSLEMIWDQSIIGLGKNSHKTTKNSEVKKKAEVFKNN